MTGHLNVESLHSDFGARITGTALSGDLSDTDVASIREAIDTYSFLCFPDQDMTDEKQLAFTRILGEPEAEHVTIGSTGKVTYFGTVGNVRDELLRDGEPLGADAWAGLLYTIKRVEAADNSSARKLKVWVAPRKAAIPGAAG